MLVFRQEGPDAPQPHQLDARDSHLDGWVGILLVGRLVVVLLLLRLFCRWRHLGVIFSLLVVPSLPISHTAGEVSHLPQAEEGVGVGVVQVGPRFDESFPLEDGQVVVDWDV